MRVVKILLILLCMSKGNLIKSHNNEVANLQTLYLDLIKKVILNTIYEPNKRPYAYFVAHTMISKERMDNIQHCVEEVLSNNIPGDLIETGAWRGGATIFMRALLEAYGDSSRIVWVADSFEGLPAPDITHFPNDADCFWHKCNFLKVSLKQVQENFKAYGLLDDQVKFLKGFFKDTMQNNPIKQLALLRLDGDMYESTIQVLESLYDKLSVGGYVIIDDYNLKWARKAMEDFRQQRNILDPLIDIDGAGVYWKKTGA